MRHFDGIRKVGNDSISKTDHTRPNAYSNTGYMCICIGECSHGLLGCVVQREGNRLMKT